MSEPSLKQSVANTLKWNLIDRVASQILYAVTGVVLANLLSKEDFGLVGAVMVFQAFGSLFVDSGFSSALIQRKSPSHLDYSTVLWFNLGMAAALYALLWVAAPWIASLFQGDMRIVPLSRVMFLSFIINASAIVQTNRLMKRMDVKMVAASNSIGLIVSAVVGIWLAVAGYGAWAIVWQTLALATVKSAILWLTSGWLPLMRFSLSALRSFFKVGSGVMVQSFLNTLFLNIYGFFIGNRAGLVSLGYYTQADKWSKMGIMSLSQMLTSSFLPLLSQVQDEPQRYARMCLKTNRFTSYLVFPAMLLLMAMATPIFHTLFGTKWDGAIILFQILLLRGVFTVLTLLYNNFILSLGHAKVLVVTEAVRDGVALLAIFVTLPYIALSQPGQVTQGLEIFLYGQLAASVVSWAVTLAYASKLAAVKAWHLIGDSCKYLLLTLAALSVPIWVSNLGLPPLAVCVLQGVSFAVMYVWFNHASGSKIQADLWAYVRGRKLN